MWHSTFFMTGPPKPMGASDPSFNRQSVLIMSPLDHKAGEVFETQLVTVACDISDGILQDLPP
jgi:hypothetical protein